MSELRALRERVEKAEGPDREIDGLIAAQLEGWTLQKFKGDSRPYWRAPENSNPERWFMRASDGPPHYTASIDAAVALIERKMGEDPWYCLERQDSLDNKFFAQVAPKWWCGNEAIKRGMREGAPAGTAWAKTPALALIAALLNALENVPALRREPRT